MRRCANVADRNAQPYEARRRELRITVTPGRAVAVRREGTRSECSRAIPFEGSPSAWDRGCAPRTDIGETVVMSDGAKLLDAGFIWRGEAGDRCECVANEDPDSTDAGGR